MTKTKHNSFSKKALSVLLTVVMAFGYIGLLSGVFGLDLFGTKQTAEAATAGDYYIKITGAMEGWKFTFVSASNLNNTFTAGWDSSTNDSAGMVVRYKTNNGTASNTNDKTVDLHSWGNPMPTNKQDRTSNTTVPGFPTGFYFCLDQNDAAGGTKLYITKIEVGPSASSLTTIWSGEIKLDSTNGTKKAFIYQDGNSSTSSNASVSSNPGWNMPYVNEGTLSGDDSASIELTANGTASSTYSFSGAKDQYGVVWGPDPTWSVSGGNSTNSGSTVTFNNGTGVDYTATVKASFASGNSSHNPAEFTKSVSVSTRHTLTVKANGGNWSGSTADKTYYGHTGDTQEIPEPSRTGYTFNGWTVSGGSLNGTTYTFANRNTSTLTAKWILNDYTATFLWDNVPNSSGALEAAAKTRVDTYHITDSNSFSFPNDSDLAKDYYTFDGKWKVTNVSGEGTWSVSDNPYSAGDSFGTNKYGDVTFRAQYTPVDYQIKFDPNSGQAVPSNFSTPYDNLYKYNYENRTKSDYTLKTTLPATVYIGYTLVGWQPTANVGNWDSTQVYPAGTSLAGMHGSVAGDTVELKAVWESVTSTVSLDLSEGGSIGGGSTSLAYAFSSPLTLPNPSRTGYVFKGWKVTAIPAYGDDTTTYPTANRWVQGQEYNADVIGNEIQPVVLPANMLGSVTLKPIWEHIEYTITYAGNGGTAPAVKTYHIDDAAFTLPSSTRNGYTFTGWQVSPAGNWTAENLLPADTSISGKWGNVTLTAQWTQTPYTIYLDVNGGDALANTRLTYRTESSTTLTKPTRTGYDFKGWKVVAPIEGNWVEGTVYAGSSPAAPTGFYGDLHLQAQWEHTKYTITLSGGNAAGTRNYYIDDTAFTLGESPLAGYGFDYWTVNANAGNWVKDTQYQADTSISGKWGNVSLTAHFTPVIYTITYKDGDQVLGTQNYTINAPGSLRDNYDKAGYAFKGWRVVSVADNGGGWTVGNTFTLTGGLALSADMYYGNVTLAPILEARQYTVTYDFNGAAATCGPLAYTIESVDELPGNESSNPPAKTGHDFSGWKVTAVGEEGNWTLNDIAGGNTAVTGKYGNVTLTAQWTPKQYTITYITGAHPEGVTRQGTYGQLAPDDLTDAEKAKPADAQYEYTFDCWNPELTTVTGEKTYTAEYSRTLRSYNVEWYLPSDVNGELSNYTLTKTTTSDYGTEPDYGGVPIVDSASQTYSWTFEGWATAPDGEPLETLPNVEGPGVKYYAVFSKELTPINVTWVINGEPHTGDTCGVGKTPSWKGATPTKPDEDPYVYVFDGWEPTPTVVNEGDPDRTYTATFRSELKTYTVTLGLNGGVLEGDLSFTYKMGDTKTFPAPGKNGYIFAGWQLDAAVGTWPAGTTVPAGDYVTEDLWGDVSFTALWTPENYTITFNPASESDVLPDPVSYNIESTDALPAAEREGHTFGGWVVSVGGGNWQQGAALAVDYALNENYGDVTLTPIWQINTYHIDWISGDYTQTSEVEYGSAIIAYTPVSKMGYTAEWEEEVPAAMPAENLVFHAKYTPVQYYIRLNVNGGNPVDNFYYTINGDNTLPTPTRSGATFAGWKVAAAQGNWSKNSVLAGGESLNGKYGNVSLTAQWDLETHLVIWVAGDVTRETEWLYGAMPSYDGTPYKSPDESHSYQFIGWDKEIVPVTEDVTYTAQFEATERKYTVVWNIDGATRTEEYSYGATPVYPGENDPVRASTPDYDFTFSGWSPAVTDVTADVTYYAQFDVFVKLKGLSIDISSLQMNIDDSEVITARLDPADATIHDVVWTSKNTDVATVDNAGTIKAVSPGIALINVSSVDKSFNAYCVVTVAPVHTSYVAITANGVSTTQLAGAMLQLSATIQPDNATDSGIRWSTGDAAVATVDQSGLVKFVGVGETDITALASDGFSVGSIHVVTTVDEAEVEDTVKTYLITFGEFNPGFKMAEDGEVYKSGRLFVAEGESVSFKLAVDDSKQSRYTIYSNSTKLRSGDGYWYTIEDIHDNMVIRFTDSAAGVGTPEEEDEGGSSGSQMGFFQRLAAFFRKIVEFFRNIFKK